jgi:hypothetical protein
MSRTLVILGGTQHAHGPTSFHNGFGWVQVDRLVGLIGMFVIASWAVSSAPQVRYFWIPLRPRSSADAYANICLGRLRALRSDRITEASPHGARFFSNRSALLVAEVHRVVIRLMQSGGKTLGACRIHADVLADRCHGLGSAIA